MTKSLDILSFKIIIYNLFVFITFRLNKHLNVLPAVAVIFMELDWNDPNW
jgi:hypothetical protein